MASKNEEWSLTRVYHVVTYAGHERPDIDTKEGAVGYGPNVIRPIDPNEEDGWRYRRSDVLQFVRWLRSI